MAVLAVVVDACLRTYSRGNALLLHRQQLVQNQEVVVLSSNLDCGCSFRSDAIWLRSGQRGSSHIQRLTSASGRLSSRRMSTMSRSRAASQRSAASYRCGMLSRVGGIDVGFCARKSTSHVPARASMAHGAATRAEDQETFCGRRDQLRCGSHCRGRGYRRRLAAALGLPSPARGGQLHHGKARPTMPWREQTCSGVRPSASRAFIVSGSWWTIKVATATKPRSHAMCSSDEP